MGQSWAQPCSGRCGRALLQKSSSGGIQQVGQSSTVVPKSFSWLPAGGRGRPPHTNASPFTIELMITIVSGLPRSGTSLMMQMLDAGGMPVLSDGERGADVDNPRGYLEWERIKQLPKNPGCIAEAEGKAVKVISQLLLSLPAQHEYRVIFMQRPLPEVMASQDEMLRRRGNFDPSEDNSVVARAFQEHLSDVYGWLNGKPYVKVRRVQ